MASETVNGCRCSVCEQSPSSKTVSEIGEEFDHRMKINFKRYVYLFTSTERFALDSATHLAAIHEGYEGHRIVFCKDKASHIHFRYSTEENAKRAIENFKKHPRLTAGRVYDLLRELYITERLCTYMNIHVLPSWTLAIVDYDGLVEHTNPLAKDVLEPLLQKFGKPCIFYNKEYRNINHVQVLFSSMAEALGASIEHGYWYSGYESESRRFHYRIRIVASDKETKILKHTCTFNPEDGAYDLDYFIGSCSTEDYNASPSFQYPYPSESFYISEPTRGIENESGNPYRREFTSSNRRSNKPSRGQSSRNRRYLGSEYSQRFPQATSAESGQMTLRREVEREAKVNSMHVPN